MNKDQDLLKQAIADAKAVRETALANARLALQEAFTPKLQSMLSAKLRNEMEGDFGKEGEEEVPTGLDDTQKELDPTVAKEETDVTAIAGNDPEKGKAGDVGPESGSDTATDASTTTGKKTISEDDDEVEGDEVPGEDEIDVTADAEGVPAAGEDEIPAEEDGSDEEDVELEALVKELESEDVPELDEPRFGEDETELPKEATDVTDIASEDPEKGLAGDVGPESGSDTATDATPTTGAPTVGAGEETGEEEVELDLEALVKEVEAEAGIEGEKEDEDEKELAALQSENKALAKSLKEHRDVVIYLRSKLNEINLLNAKLLYSNKLFRANNLTESQKLRVIESLDRANSVREAKLVYATLAEALKVKKTPITESVKKEVKGSASKTVASTKPSNEKILSEGVDLATRFKQLAGVKNIKKFL